MKKVLKNEKGFTLIELAIVLVVIGIIIGAVIKGQDLIENARHKRFTSEVKQWEVATWAYFDRMGRFPGDSSKDGIIGDGSGENVKTDFTSSGLVNAPTTNTIQLGSAKFSLFLGNASSAGVYRNIIAVCQSESCGASFTHSSDLDFLRSVDSSIDGEANGAAGKVRAVTSTVTGSSGTWIASATAPSFADWASNTRALFYFFDRPY